MRFDEIREVAISLGGVVLRTVLHHHQGVAGGVAEPEHRRHRVAHPRDLGIDVDAQALHLRVSGVDVVSGQRDAGLLGLDVPPPWGGGASAMPVVPSGG